MTMQTVTVLDRLATARDDDPVWGLRICEEVGLGPGSVYPILERLRKAGWITAFWEDAQPSGRPRRCYYTITSTGRAECAAALAARAAKRRRWTTLQPGQVTS
jgi:DNA-binding PadR family transcriptional regulator